MQENNIYDLIIIGGGCAGMAAGIYGGRAKMKTLIIEKAYVGGQAAISYKIDNYPGLENISGAELARKFADQAKNAGCEIVYESVKEVILKGSIKEVKSESKVYKSKAVIIAGGASPKKAGFYGEEEFTGKGVGYCATCDGAFYKGKNVFVVGGGNSAGEEALFLTKFAKKVTVLVRKDKMRCSKSIEEELHSNHKTKIMFNTELVKVFGEDNIKGVVLKNNLTGEEKKFTAADDNDFFGVFVFVGYKPASELFLKEVSSDKDGYIITDESMRTDIDGVFAAGDVRKKMLRQIVTAVSDGAVAAYAAQKYLENKY